MRRARERNAGYAQNAVPLSQRMPLVFCRPAIPPPNAGSRDVRSRGLFFNTFLLQSRLFPPGGVSRKKPVSEYVQYAFARFFPSSLPGEKIRLFADEMY